MGILPSNQPVKAHANASLHRAFLGDRWSRAIRLSISISVWRLFYCWLPVDDVMRTRGATIVLKCQSCEAYASISHLFYIVLPPVRFGNFWCHL